MVVSVEEGELDGEKLTVLSENICTTINKTSHKEQPLSLPVKITSEEASPGSSSMNSTDFEEYDSDESYHSALSAPFGSVGDINDTIPILHDSKTSKNSITQIIAPLIDEINLCLQQKSKELIIRQKVNQHILSVLSEPVNMNNKCSCRQKGPPLRQAVVQVIPISSKAKAALIEVESKPF